MKIPSTFWITHDILCPDLFGLENEVILVDEDGVPNGDHSADILKVLQDPCLKRELDKCQIEEYNSTPHTRIEDCITQIQESHYRLQKEVEKRGLKILTKSVPDLYTEPEYSDDILSIKDLNRYQSIDLALREANIRHTTNIAWLHLNFSGVNGLQQFACASNYIHSLVSKNLYDLLGTCKDRLDLYIEATVGMNQSQQLKDMMWLKDVCYLPGLFSNPFDVETVLLEGRKFLLRNDSGDSLSSYRLVRSKNNIHQKPVFETRNVQAGHDVQTIESQAKLAYTQYLIAQDSSSHVY